MGIPVRMKTQAELQLAAQFAALVDVSPERRAAFAQFEATGLPHRRIEEYHFTDLRAHLREILPPADADEAVPSRPEAAATSTETVIVIKDGRYNSALSDAMPEGIHLHEQEPEGGTPSDPVLALNRAFCAHELVITLAPGVHPAKPLRLKIQSSQIEGRAIYRRAKVVLGEGASLTLLETNDGTRTPNQANVVLTFALADHATLAHVASIAAGQGLVLNSLVADIGAHCKFSSFALLTGGTLVRRQLFVTLNGEHTELSLDGVTLLRGTEHIDTTLVVTHKAAHCTSRETFRNIIDGDAHGVFQGKIIVKPGAQKTDGKMMSKAVLLSEAGIMDNKPELEIFADDVVCGHGATVGALDKDQLFYAQARGIPKPQAEALLLEAFAGEVIDTISHEPAREELRSMVSQWLAHREA